MYINNISNKTKKTHPKSGKMRHWCLKMQTFGLSFSNLMLMFLFSSFLMCQVDAAVITSATSVNRDSSSSISDLIQNEPIKIKLLAPNTMSKKHTRTRQNSRFLRTFPPVDLLDLARQSVMNNEIEPVSNYNRNYNRNPVNYNNYYGTTNTWPEKSNRIDSGNSPIFYIKLPPVPYIYMPGVGYVSPHPYSNSPSMPMAMSSGQAMMPGFSAFIPTGQETSVEQNQSVISLPLKFLSNGRPHQIESSKRKKRPGIKENSSENKGASLISGGKYNFNGRPTAVFVVRSPAGMNKFMDQ